MVDLDDLPDENPAPAPRPTGQTRKAPPAPTNDLPDDLPDESPTPAPAKTQTASGVGQGNTKGDGGGGVPATDQGGSGSPDGGTKSLEAIAGELRELAEELDLTMDDYGDTVRGIADDLSRTAHSLCRHLKG